MTNMFKELQNNTRTIIIFIWPLSCVLAALSIILMLEDYSTSKAGYMALPTQKLNTSGYVILAVAALPQAGQIVLGYIWARDTRKGWSMILAIIFFLADLSTDVYYKSNGEWSLVPLAVIESLFIFTLGSEVLFTIAVGFVTETFGDFIVSLSAFIKSGLSALQSASEIFGIGASSEKDNHKVNNR